MFQWLLGVRVDAGLLQILHELKTRFSREGEERIGQLPSEG